MNYQTRAVTWVQTCVYTTLHTLRYIHTHYTHTLHT